MADLIRAKLVGSKELKRRLKKMNPKLNKRITTPALLEAMQLTLRIAAREKILPGGGRKVPPRPDILTSRTGTLRGSLTTNFAVAVNAALQFVEGGSHLIYAAVHEATRRAFLKPAKKQAEPRYEAIFVKHWARAGEVG